MKPNYHTILSRVEKVFHPNTDYFPEESPIQKVQELGQWLSQFNYENLTKRRDGKPRDPDQIITEQRERGAGGTCFSIVNLADRKAREMNLEPRFYLGDRPDGEGRHCVIGFPRHDVFLDPGYLCFEPIPLNPVDELTMVRPHNTLHAHLEDDRHLRVCTARMEQKTWRYTLDTQPVDRNRFRKAWRESFGWQSVMNSLVLTRLRDEDMLLYINGRLDSIRREQRQSLTTPDHLSDSEYLSDLFNIDRELIQEWNLEVES